MGRTLQLGAIGTVAGLFGGVFGVGGGIVIVPLLVLRLGYDEREATGTSLAAIVLIGIVAATLQGVYGNLRYGYGLAIGIPAVAGVVAGTWLPAHLREPAPARGSAARRARGGWERRGRRHRQRRPRARARGLVRLPGAVRGLPARQALVRARTT